MDIPTPEQVETAAREKGLSIAGMCRRANIDMQSFYRWKSGRQTPTLTTLRKMLDAIKQEPE